MKKTKFTKRFWAGRNEIGIGADKLRYADTHEHRAKYNISNNKATRMKTQNKPNAGFLKNDPENRSIFFLSRFYFEKIWCCVCPFVKAFGVCISFLHMVFVLWFFFICSLHYYYLFNFSFAPLKERSEDQIKKKKTPLKKIYIFARICNFQKHWTAKFNIAEIPLVKRSNEEAMCFFHCMRHKVFLLCFQICFFYFHSSSKEWIRSSNKSIYFSHIWQFVFWKKISLFCCAWLCGQIFHSENALKWN